MTFELLADAGYEHGSSCGVGGGQRFRLDHCCAAVSTSPACTGAAKIVGAAGHHCRVGGGVERCEHLRPVALGQFVEPIEDGHHHPLVDLPGRDAVQVRFQTVRADDLHH
jgi:hypothetical protein